MDQYNQPEDSKPRIKLPVTHGDTAADLQELKKQIVRHSIQLEKIQREQVRIKNEIDSIRNYLKSKS